MRGEAIAAERSKEVRDAGRAWRRVGFLSEESWNRIVAMYPDDRRRFGAGFRALAFIFTLIATWALLGLWFLLIEKNPQTGAGFLIWAAVMAALTEFQRGPLKRADAGAEAATALMAVVLASAGGTILFDDNRFEDILLRFLVSAVLACSIAAWRWGDVLFFLGGACRFSPFLPSSIKVACYGSRSRWRSFPAVFAAPATGASRPRIERAS